MPWNAYLICDLPIFYHINMWYAYQFTLHNIHYQQKGTTIYGMPFCDMNPGNQEGQRPNMGGTGYPLSEIPICEFCKIKVHPNK